ncbi:MAG: hypothetical protein ACYDB3_11840, partial [Acidimicrobiales bacterium]
MALESLPAHSTGDGERTRPDSRGERPGGSVQEWFQDLGRDLAWSEQRANEPPADEPSVRARDSGL